MTVVLPGGGTKRKELGHLLVEQGHLKDAQLTQALTFQKQTGKPLGEVLVALGLVAVEDVTRARAQQVDAAYVAMEDVAVDKEILTLVPAAVAHQYAMLPIGKTPDGTLKIIVAAWNARVMEAAHKIATANRMRIAPAIATEAPLLAAIAHWYGPAPERPEPPREAAAGPRPVPAAASALPRPGSAAARADDKRTEDKRASDVFSGSLATVAGTAASGQPDALDAAGVDQPAVIQFINKILTDAILCGASDIHLEPRRNSLEVRFRQDGTLRSVDSIRREFQPACSSRLKIMAEMNIAERRLPQDGRISVTVEGRAIDMRVSSLPTQYGESLVLRILDKSGVRPSLAQLGFSERNLHSLNSLIRKPHGIFLATGPTGSGKTTTLYSAIHEIHTPDVNIITVEDPIEYELDGIRQSNVNEKAGLTFARQLRAILRQDPDIIYVGEIRDQETAEIAFRAALTGHLVFSTLHCNDAAGAITRLLNMGMDPFLVASSVVGILAQRLVRKVCPQCARPSPPADVDLLAFGVDPDSPEFHRAKFLSGPGCDFCAGVGYKGRASVQELMVMDDGIRAMTLGRVPSHKIRQAAMARGMQTMRQDAAAKVMQGVTTFEEAQKRVYIEESGEE